MQKVSIITINRNNAKGLECTIESVISQAYQNIEYIVIDGASSDGSQELIKQYSGHITYWVSEPDGGVYNAMNKGIRVATGDYLLFLNSGDILKRNDTLSLVFDSEQSADILSGSIVTNTKFLTVRDSAPDKITLYHFWTSTLWHQATFFKRYLFQELGYYDETLKISSDWKFMLLALVKYDKTYKKLEQDIAIMEPAGISCVKDSDKIIRQEHEETLKKYFAPFYEDYQELYRRKKYSWPRISRYVRWRMNQLFIHKK